MKKMLMSLIASFSLLLFTVAVPALAAGANDQIFNACKNNANSAVCQDEAAQNVNNANPVNHYIHVATDIVAILVGLAAVVMIIISGFRFVTAGGNAESAKSARQTLIAALIGLAIAGLAWTLINFAVDKLITT